MALNDFRPVDSSAGPAVAHTYAVKAGAAATIKAGEMVIKDADDAGYVSAAANGASNSSVWVGVAATTSTETATVDGVVEVYDNPITVFRGKPTTAANLARAIVFTQVTLDVGSVYQTIDENDTSNGTFIIVGFDTNEDTIDFRFATNDHITAG